MNDYQNWNKTGELIKDAVTDALQSGDFKELNRLVSQTVTNTLNEAGIHITLSDEDSSSKKQSSSNDFSGNGDSQADTNHTQQNQYQQKSWQAQQNQYQQKNWQAQQNQYQQNDWQKQHNSYQQNDWQKQQQILRRQQERQQRWQAQQTRLAEQFRRRQAQQMQKAEQSYTQMQPRPGAALSLVKMNRVGSVSGVLYQVFGGIGLGVTGIVTFIRLLALAAGGTSLGGWIVNLGFLALFFGMIHLGIRQKKRLNRAERYVQLCDCRMFGEIEQLAKNTGKSCRYVAKDLQKMLRLGIFPEGHLDSQNTCFMLNDVVYRQYLETENNRIEREEADKKTPENKNADPAEDISSSTLSEQEAELNTMVAEGMEYIRKLRELNDRIPGDVISKKLFRLENLLKEIFDSIREHPEQMHRMHKLMDYYLPTTLKLVEAYEEFDQVSAPGEEIVNAKAEIENTLDTINQAFTELLNNLFQAAVFDATTDAQVLKTMLAKEGLTRDMEFTGNSQK